MAETAYTQTPPIRVFISYAWEDVEYRRLVESLAKRLQDDGVEVRLDEWHLRGTTIPEFMNREVRLAHKVLVVCSPQYRSKIHAMEDGHISGVGWEAMLVNSAIYTSVLARDQVVPLLLKGTWPESAPLFLQGFPYIDLSNPGNFEVNYKELLRRIAGYEPEPVKPLSGISESTGSCLQFAMLSSGKHEYVSQRFSPPISKFLESNSFKKLHGHVKRLTDEQYIVLDFLRHERRVLISGSAGSGKTLVAAEKAIRLSQAYPHVLFLCHNPQLASYVSSNLTTGTAVHVADFGSWVRDFAPASEGLHVADWTHFDGPDNETLAIAFENLSAMDHKYDAIIVDEAQDFRSEWWAVVEAGLRPGGYFYVFHDDNQSLLPHRGSYPNIGPHIDLSRNCRNAGRVFELMRCFARTLPVTKLPGGSVLLMPYRSGEEHQKLSKILAEVFQHDGIKRTVVLWAGPEPIDQAPVANCKITVSVADGWKEEVIRQFGLVLHKYDCSSMTFPPGGAKWVEDELDGLSNAPYPTQADILRVQRVANSFRIAREARSTIQRSRTRLREPIHWVSSGSILALKYGTRAQIWGEELMLYFQRHHWNKGIPEPTVLRITPHREAKDQGSIPLYSVPDFKGLESDIVILCMRGRNLAQKEVTYVGISRARAMLVILADELAARDLPSSFHWDLAPLN